MELDPLPQTIEGWYQMVIKFDCQWRIAKAEEAFYGRANARKKLLTQNTPPTQGQAKEWKPWQQGQWQQGFRNQMQPNQQCQNPPPAPKDPNAMDVDRNRQQRPPIKCFKCNKPGHMARDCKGRLDVRAMMHDEMMDYFKEQIAARKDREELKKKQDFPAATQ